MTQFTIKDTKHKGKGLYSNNHFDKNQILFRFDGETLSYEDTLKYPKICDRFLQIGKDLYLNLEKHYGVFANHDCNPNCYIKIIVNNAFLLSSREINPGDEITTDYSLTCTETPEQFVMTCGCSKFNCRQIITGFNSITKEKQAILIKEGKVPKYVLEHYGLKY
jgi:hypothetical protein